MPSEFSSLFDLVTSRGYSHSHLTEEIKFKILHLLRDKYPKTPIDSEVVLDTDSGKVRIYSEGQDLTPKGFAVQAESLARHHLINLLSISPSKPAPSEKISLPDFHIFRKFFNVVAIIFFAGYNLIFTLGSALWLSSLIASRTSLSKIVLALLMLFIPISSLVLTTTRKFYKSTGILLRTFFFIEIPLLIVLIIAGNFTTGSNRFLLFVILNLFFIPLVLLASQIKILPTKLALTLSFFKTMTFMVWGYLVLLYTLVVPKIITLVFELNFGNLGYPRYRSYDYYSSERYIDPSYPLSFLWQIGWGVIGFSFALLLTALPFLVLWLLYRTFRSKTFAQHHAVFALIVITLFLGFAFQPNLGKYVKPLETLGSSTATFAQKDQAAKLLYPEKAKLKKFISEARENRNSYLFAKDEHVFDTEIFNTLFLNLAYPFVYQGPENIYSLQNGYNQLFTTYVPTNPSVSKNVSLSYRKVSYSPTPSGALAEVTIEEEYDNQTSVQQEVIYEFTLYPGSVVTDLKLGPDLEFTGQIAPRGAAQKTYESQLRQNRDPALLEQIGSNTYRLRVFPIPGNRDFTTLKGKHQKVSFTYITTTAPEGFPLPVYTQQINVKTGPATSYLMQEGTQVSKFDPANKYILSKFVPCVNEISDVLISLSCKDFPAYPPENKIAVLLDVSLKNNASANVDQLKIFAKKYEFDLYKYNTQLSEVLPSSELDNVVFWGESDLTKILPKISKSYDAFFIVTGSNSPLKSFNNYNFSITTPVYFIHNKTPGYELEFLSRIFQSGGMVTNSFDEAVTHYSLTHTVPDDKYQLNKYFMVDSKESVSGPLAKLSQYAKLAQLVQSSPTNILNNITKLDELNQLAKEANIVTPYSSLIALVNDQQQQILKNFEGQYNRYEDTAVRENFAPSQGPRIVNPMMELAPLGGSFKTAPSAGDAMMGGGGSFGGISNPAYAPLKSSSSLFPNYGIVIMLALPIVLALPVVLIYYLLKFLHARKTKLDTGH